MKLNTVWKGSGLIALALALTVPPVAAQAQDSERQYRNRGEQLADRQQQREARRAIQIDNQSEARAARIERNGDRAARQAARQGEYQRAARIDRQSERAARQVEQRGDRRAGQVAQGRDWQERNRDWSRDRDRQGRDWNDRDRNGRNWHDRSRDGHDWNDRSRDGRNWHDRNRDGRDWNDRNRDRGWNDRDRNWRDNRSDRYRDARRDYREYRQDQRRWDRRWRHDNRYNWSHYRSVNRGLYSPGRYYAPYRNYGYRPLTIGIRLNSLFFDSRYQINDPWRYRLPQAYGEYRWIRYYDDVLLVDTYTGQVVDVIHNFFW